MSGVGHGAADSARNSARAAWTGPGELRARLGREWERGRLPAALLAAELGLGSPDAAEKGDRPEAAADQESAAAASGMAPDRPRLGFPLRLSLRGPDSAELGERFAESRAWIAELRAGEGKPGYELAWRELERHPLGGNRVPVAAILATPADALALAGKRREGKRLLELARSVHEAFPELGPWLLRRPHEVLERAEEWPAILGALAWFRAHPRSGLYARQIDAPGVHSKFVETRRGLFAELLDLILPPEAVVRSATGAAGFARRYGLAEKPALVRFRSLDAGLRLGAAGLASVGELCLRAADFAALYPSGACPFAELFVTENEVNFLAFPAREGAAVLLGSGYGFSALAEATWLRGLRLHYWGDLDSHGFAILDQFRALFPAAESFLMDRATLLAHRGLWTTEPTPTSAALSRLTEAEAALYDELREGRLAPALRLEQERIGFRWLEQALQAVHDRDRGSFQGTEQPTRH